MPSKKDKKNGKETGGVVAAVTKHAATKFASGGLSPEGLGANPSPPTGLSPELNALTPSSNGNPTTSPALDAVSGTSFATSIAANANDWSKGVNMGLASSPGNLISLTGESPPTRPSSYEDTTGMPNNWQSPGPHLYNQPASASPPSTMSRRPLSVQMDTQYRPPELPTSLAHPTLRRSSLHSHIAQSRGTQNPPLPHQPQAHFYAAPEIDFDLHRQTGIRAGDRGYFFGFDSLPGLSENSGKGTVALAGYEGGLEVYSVGKRGLEQIASLVGLRGGVVHAKILPWIDQRQHAKTSPLIAVVVHGPVLESSADIDHLVPGQSTPASGGIPGSPRPSLAFDLGQQRSGEQSASQPAFYQTSVEIYSLKTSKKVATLLEMPRAALKVQITSPIFQAPPPVGDLQIKADAHIILISSGVTGESWLFREVLETEGAGLQYACCGKIWATVPAPFKDESSAGHETSRATGLSKSNSQQAIVAINGRWIAYCPAAPSSQVALQAKVPVRVLGKAPGVNSMTPPQLPLLNADIDGPSEGMVNKLVRDATQEAIKGAKWIGQQGLQAWNNYWSPPTQGTPSPRGPSTISGVTGAYSPRLEQAQFPPTHGTPAPAVYKEPGLISILAVDTLPNSTMIHPMATFAAPLGCSFLSFSPTGLALFTANSKGDVQNVWDLFRLQFNRSSAMQTATLTNTEVVPRIRQLANYSRMTVARVVDVAWTKPYGDRLAMVTERGTVHLRDLPPSAFVWPPPRRRANSAKPAAAVSDEPASTMSMATNAFSSAIEAARPLLDRSRRSSGNSSHVSRSGIVEQASHGGKVLAAGISHSLGKTGSAISQLRQTGESRVSLPMVRLPPSPGCVTWIGGRKQQHLYVIGSGLVRTFPNRDRKSANTVERLRTPHLTRYKDFKVPFLPDGVIAPAVREFLDLGGQLQLTEEELHPEELNNLAIGPSEAVAVIASPGSSIPQAEIESSAPYQPFHTDRRVALFEYGVEGAPAAANVRTESVLLTEGTPKKKKGTASANIRAERAPPWTFGQSIDAAKLDLGLPALPDDDASQSGLAESRALPASEMERVLEHVGENEDQIVVTTRRRRGAIRFGSGGADEDGFFEDDCEVLDFADQRV